MRNSGVIPPWPFFPLHLPPIWEAQGSRKYHVKRAQEQASASHLTGSVAEEKRTEEARSCRYLASISRVWVDKAAQTLGRADRAGLLFFASSSISSHSPSRIKRKKNEGQIKVDYVGLQKASSGHCTDSQPKPRVFKWSLWHSCYHNLALQSFKDLLLPEKGVRGGAKWELLSKSLFFYSIHTRWFMLKVCVCERAWLHIWQAHVSTGDLPSRCLRRAPSPPTSPNVYQSGAARGPSLKTGSSKQDDFYRLRMGTRETVGCFHVKDAYCVHEMDLEIKKINMFPVDETDVWQLSLLVRWVFVNSRQVTK